MPMTEKEVIKQRVTYDEVSVVVSINRQLHKAFTMQKLLQLDRAEVRLWTPLLAELGRMLHAVYGGGYQ